RPSRTCDGEGGGASFDATDPVQGDVVAEAVEEAPAESVHVPLDGGVGVEDPGPAVFALSQRRQVVDRRRHSCQRLEALRSCLPLLAAGIGSGTHLVGLELFEKVTTPV